MNIKRFIDQNNKLILYVIFIIIFVLLVIKSLNSYYENEEKEKLQNIIQNNTTGNTTANNNTSNNSNSTNTENEQNANLNTIEGVMSKFVSHCNNNEIQDAYNMISDECKNAMYKTPEDFESKYVKKIFTEKKEYSMQKWAADENIVTYQIKFLGDILATGGEGNISQEYYTFIKKDDSYKININNYICGKNLNKELTNQGITIKIKNINVYNSYEEYEISFTNNTSKEISLTGNKYVKNIYLKNSRGTTYSSLNSKFDKEEITLKPNNTKNYKVKFNKNYNPQNKVNTLVLSDVIFDYEEYLKYENKSDYANRTSIEIKF